jgi:hypothetical protein
MVVKFSVEARDFSLLQSVQTGFRARKLSIQWVMGALYPDVKRPVQGDRSPLLASKLRSGDTPPFTISRHGL